MIIREVLLKEKTDFNKVVDHPLQSWEWGEFRIATGIKVLRLGVFEPDKSNKKMTAGWQILVHPVPSLPFNIIYFPRGPAPDGEMLASLRKIALQEKAVFVKLEPNVVASPTVREFLLKNDCQEGKAMFTKYTFQLDLGKGEEAIMAGMKPKTRYNVRLAQKHGVEVTEDNSEQGLETFIGLFFETTNRQKFYGHTPDYYRKMRQALGDSGMYHMLLAKHGGKTLAAYLFFIFNKTLYYPYGASSREGREVMPTYALFWEAIKMGIKNDCTSFDMWGSPGPNPTPSDPWYGFHHFKEGFGANLVEFTGTYDLVVNEPVYKILNLANEARWKLLRFRKTLPF